MPDPEYDMAMQWQAEAEAEHNAQAEAEMEREIESELTEYALSSELVARLRLLSPQVTELLRANVNTLTYLLEVKTERNMAQAEVLRLRRELADALADCDQMRRALAPFATLTHDPVMEGSHEDDCLYDGCQTDLAITVGDLRRARRAYDAYIVRCRDRERGEE